jgi:hypothetical protein
VKRSSHAALAADPVDRLGQTLAAAGLEQVVDRVLLEGAHGVMVVGGHEDHGRTRVETAQEVEPVLARHLDVEQQQVDPLRCQSLARLDGRGGLADHGDAADLLEHPPQPRPGEALVVHDQDAEPVAASLRGGRPGFASIHLPSLGLHREPPAARFAAAPSWRRTARCPVWVTR